MKEIKTMNIAILGENTYFYDVFAPSRLCLTSKVNHNTVILYSRCFMGLILKLGFLAVGFWNCSVKLVLIQMNVTQSLVGT